MKRDEASLPDLASLRSDDAAAWTAAFQLLWPIAVRAARYAVPNLTPSDVEDVASEALAQLPAELDRLTSADELKPLAVTITYRRAISWARRQSAVKRPQWVTPAPGIEGREFRVDQVAAEPERSALDHERGELRALMNQALAELDEDTRRLLRDKFLLGLTYEEISARDGVPVGSLCSKVMRSLRKARRLVKVSPALMKELGEFLR